MRNLLFVAVLGLVVYSIIDVARSEPDERYGIARPLWILLILLVPVLGSIAWLVARSQARARGAGGRSGGPGPRSPRPAPRAPRRPQGPLAPDDDPEFLWRLEQMQRRADTERRRGADGVAPTGDPTDSHQPSQGADDAGGHDPDGDDTPGHDTPGHGNPGPRAGA